MTAVPPDHLLTPGERAYPVLWCYPPLQHPLHPVTDDDLDRLGIDHRKSRLVKSWGHNEHGVHWLLTRGGTNVHTDKAYLRYTHQIVLRNDGTRIRGLPTFDPDNPAEWHPPMTPGAFYCLDTWSPHQGIRDPRLGPWGERRIKLVIAVDRPEPLEPGEAFALMQGYLHRRPTDDPMTDRPPKWRFTPSLEPGKTPPS